MNKNNKELYDSFYNLAINDGLDAVNARKSAVTNLIAKSIIDKNYRVYYGGGYYNDKDKNGEYIPVEMFDVVCYFNFSNIPHFMLVTDTDGDSANLILCNKDNMYEVLFI